MGVNDDIRPAHVEQINSGLKSNKSQTIDGVTLNGQLVSCTIILYTYNNTEGKKKEHKNVNKLIFHTKLLFVVSEKGIDFKTGPKEDPLEVKP